MATFRDLHPLDFSLMDRNHRHTLHQRPVPDQDHILEVYNAAERSVEFTPIPGTTGPDAHHLALRFRRGVLAPDCFYGPGKLGLAEASATHWDLTGPYNEPDGTDVIYLRYLGDQPALAPKAVKQVGLRQVGATPTLSQEGTQVLLQAQNLAYSHRPEQPIAAERHLKLDFEKPNDASTADQVLAMHAEVFSFREEYHLHQLDRFRVHLFPLHPPQPVRFTQVGTPEASRLVMSFQPTDPSETPLPDSAEGPINIVPNPPEGWLVRTLQSAEGQPLWAMEPTTEGLEFPAMLLLDIIGLQSVYPSGQGYLQFHLEHVSGYEKSRHIIHIGDHAHALHQHKKPTHWVEREIKNLNYNSLNEAFGTALSASDDWVFVGSPSQEWTGTLHIFKRARNTWLEHQKVVPSPDLMGGLRKFKLQWGMISYLIERRKAKMAVHGNKGKYGSSVAHEGEWAIVGSPSRFAKEKGVSASVLSHYYGRAHVYQLHQGKWVARQQLTEPRTRLCGSAVALHGNWMAVGSYGYSKRTGMVALYHLEEGQWRHKQTFNGSTHDGFAVSLALYQGWLVIGCRKHDAKGRNAGAAKVYRLVGEQWEEAQTLYASNANRYDYFGQSVALHGDTLVVGAHKQNGRGYDSGSVYVYRLQADQWTETQVLCPDTLQRDSWFGFSVSIRHNRLAIGASRHGYRDRGRVYLYHREGDTWVEQSYLDSKQPTRYFGKIVATNLDWTWIDKGTDTQYGDVHLLQAQYNPIDHPNT